MILRKAALNLLIGGMVCLGASLAWADPGEEAPSPDRTAPARSGEVLLVTSDALAEAWSPFAEWKTRCGKRTKVVTVSAIARKYVGQDIQEKIRACVLDHVASEGTRWVILGGDSLPGGKGVVPDRDTSHSLMRGRLTYRDIPTDLYYVTEGEWDANRDGVYGDWSVDDDEISYVSHAAIGRIPVRTATEVAAYTEKVVGYESRYPTGPATNMLYTCAVPMANYKAEMLWDLYLAGRWPAGELERFFVSRSKPLTPESWVAEINREAYGKMHMHGHGFLPGWVLQGNRMADARAVSRLTNGNSGLLVTTVSCFTGQFDAAKGDSIVEKILRHPKGGAVAVVAPAREGVPVFHGLPYDPRDGLTQDGTTRLLTHYWIRGLEDGLTTGEALARAKADLAGDAKDNRGYHWVLCELNLLGDPTLDMRAREAFTPTVEAPPRVGLGPGTVRVVTGSSGLTVCLWKGDEVYTVATTDARGRAVLDVAPTTRGDLLLTVSGPSANTVTDTIEVVGADGKQAKGRWY